MNNTENTAENTSTQILDMATEKIRELSNAELLSFAGLLEESTDVWLQIFLASADDRILHKIYNAIIENVDKTRRRVDPVYLIENIPGEAYNVELYPFLGVLGDIQLIESELEKRGLLKNYREIHSFIRKNHETGESEEIRYPSYVIRAFDLILGYVAGTMTMEDAMDSLDREKKGFEYAIEYAKLEAEEQAAQEKASNNNVNANLKYMA